MLELGVRTAGAAAATVGIVDDRGLVDVVGLSGYEPDDRPYWNSFHLTDALPMADAIRDRRPIVLSTTAERDRRYPLLRGRGEQRDHALVCLPLLLGDAAIGGFSASYPPDTDFGPDDLSFLRAIGEQCAQAIDRARARERATRVRLRFDALATASRTLAPTLDYGETARASVRLAVQHLGAHATLFVQERGGLEPVAHADAPSTDGESANESEHAEAALARAAADATQQATPVRVPGGGVALPLTIAGTTSGALAVGAPWIDPDDEDDIGFAQEVTRRVARAMENARLYRDRDRAAVTLQASLLPPELPSVPGIDVASLFLPAIAGYAVGGDFYDVFELDDGRWVALVGDVCGKGLEAAVLTGLARHTLRAVANVDRPSDALGQLNRALLRERIDGRFCTVALAIFDPPEDDVARATISVGGHPLPQHVRRSGEAEGVGRHGTLLGVAEKVDLHDDVVSLRQGESLVLFTDGIVGKGDAAEGSIALRSALRAGPPSSASELRDRIERYVRDEVGGDQLDDVAVLVLMAR